MKHPCLSGAVIAVPTDMNILLLQQCSLLILPPNWKQRWHRPSVPLLRMLLSHSHVLVTETLELLPMFIICLEKTAEINLANFLLKIQLLQQLTLPWYLPGVQLGPAFGNYFPGSCFLLRPQETVGGMLSWHTVCSSSWKTLLSPGPLVATKAQSPQVFEVSGTAGKACVRELGLHSAPVCQCCRSLAVFLQAQPWPWLTPEPGWGAAARAKPCLNMSQSTTCTLWWLQYRPSPGPFCSCSNAALPSFPLQYPASAWALPPPPILV